MRLQSAEPMLVEEVRFLFDILRFHECFNDVTFDELATNVEAVGRGTARQRGLHGLLEKSPVPLAQPEHQHREIIKSFVADGDLNIDIFRTPTTVFRI